MIRRRSSAVRAAPRARSSSASQAPICPRRARALARVSRAFATPASSPRSARVSAATAVVDDASVRPLGSVSTVSWASKHVVHAPSRASSMARFPSRFSIGAPDATSPDDSEASQPTTRSSARSPSLSGRQSTARPASRLAAVRSSRSSAARAEAPSSDAARRPTSTVVASSVPSWRRYRWACSKWWAIATSWSPTIEAALRSIQSPTVRCWSARTPLSTRR